MKRPYFTLEERQLIRAGTLHGDGLMLGLATKKLLRDVRKEKGWIAMKRAERYVVRIVNIKLLGRDAPRKWWQIF